LGESLRLEAVLQGRAFALDTPASAFYSTFCFGFGVGFAQGPCCLLEVGAGSAHGLLLYAGVWGFVITSPYEEIPLMRSVCDSRYPQATMLVSLILMSSECQFDPLVSFVFNAE